MVQTKTKTEYLHFTLHGADFTRLVRGIMTDGTWQKAFRMVMDGLIGINYEQTIAILMGTHKQTRPDGSG